jgi:hypothetical protein
VAQGVTTLATAAALALPVPFTPSRGSAETYSRLAEQAKVQLEQRTTAKPVFTVLPITPGRGLCRLPDQSLPLATCSSIWRAPGSFVRAGTTTCSASATAIRTGNSCMRAGGRRRRPKSRLPAIAGLEHLAEVGPVLSKKGKPTGSVIHRYRYPPQELELSEGMRLQRLEGGTLGEIVALDKLECTVELKRSKQSGDDHPTAAFWHDALHGQEPQISPKGTNSSGFVPVSSLV